ncbi:Alb1 superfamily domain-containing protein [Histoplasma capsulatum]|uniref:Alb1 superfamily domain-containing protein n=1 Tax=Ajellomyces capsulatus TaxID=5037 RepID=A0A8A1MFM8_AJECA|nr:predicted protein [Histoplasma mississippiense (nom. inval.)]EDN05891.1 predicted protein [Histoplasma mississippiense (nom. inval.)]QSS65428.1 Alb1 superfamily domain-containing protein [Histoplasma capsulatum]
MAKTAKVKAKVSSKSMHSRAAKRAVSPTNESLLKFVPRTEPIPTVKPHILSAQHNAGITKKSKSKQITRAQRKRQEKGLERAELIMDRTEKKIAKSMGKAKVVKERRSTWDDMNRKALAVPGKVVSGGDVDGAEAMDEDAEPNEARTPPVTTNFQSSVQSQQAASLQQFEFEEDGEIT